MKLPFDFGEVVERLRRSTVLIRSRNGSSGSGIIVDANGAVATNAHVVRNPELSVQLWDGRTFPAELKSAARDNDLALLSIPESVGTPAVFGDSREVHVGELVLAVGNPYGFLGAATTGVVHEVGPIGRFGYFNWIQSDIRLAPGNSGGPLGNSEGRVIGMNTMIINGAGAAIPSNTIKKFIESPDKSRRLGIFIRPLALSLSGSRRIGFRILEVEAGGPADVASLRRDDILVGVGNRFFSSTDDLQNVLDGEGESVVRLRFLRASGTQIRIATAVIGKARKKAA